MRRSFAILVFAFALGFGATPCGVRAQTESFSNETVTQFVDRMRALASDGHLDAAIAETQDYIVAHLDAIEAQRLLGDLFYRQPNLQAAERVYRSIVMRRPKDRETWNRLGGIYAAQDRIDDAITAFERSLPEASGYMNLVELHRRRGDLPAFEAAVAKYAHEHTSDAEALSNYGNVLRAMHRYDEALTQLRAARDLQPNGCTQLTDLANVWLDLGKTDTAIPLLQQCLTIEPSNYAALVNLGEANIELYRFERAQPYFELAIKTRNDRPEAFVDLGFCEDVAHHWKEAVGLYQRAISVDPLAREPYINLGYDYNEQHLYTLAEAAFIKGLSVAPADGRLLYMLGVTYNEQGKVALARQQYMRALRSDESIVVNAASHELGLLPPDPGV